MSDFFLLRLFRLLKVNPAHRSYLKEIKRWN